MILGVKPEGYPMKQHFRTQQALSNDILRTKIAFVAEKLLKFNILLVILGSRVENKILAIDTILQSRLNTTK